MQNNSTSAMGADRARIAGGQTWEMNYILRKFSVSEEKVRKAIEAVGNSRLKVENYIRAQQMKGHAH